MGFTKSWIITVCAISVVSGIITCIMPRSQTKKIFQYVCGVVIVYSILYPFITGSFQLPELSSIFGGGEQAVSFEMNEKSDEVYLFATQSGCESTAKEIITQLGLSCDSVKAECTCDNGQVNLKSITVKGIYTEEEKASVTQRLKATFSSETEIIIEGD